jgi:hypothetical protein
VDKYLRSLRNPPENVRPLWYDEIITY